MNWSQFRVHLLSVGILLAIAAIFFSPNAFSGKVLVQSDNTKARGMQAEMREYMEKEDHVPLWTNSAFAGMPTYQILSVVEGNVVRPLYKVLFLGQNYTGAWAQVFVAMFCMYLLLISLGSNWRVGLFSAVAFGITSYNIDLLIAGHSTKMSALALAPGILAGMVYLFNKRWLLGGGVFALFLTMQLLANHVQITYYTLLVIGIFFVAKGVQSILDKSIPDFAKALGIAVVAMALAFVSNASRLWPTWEYSKETIRGRSELSAKTSQGDGLDKDYLFGWSYGVGESLTLLVPHAYGGGGTESMEGTEFFDLVSRNAPPAQRASLGRQIASSFYWGNQPFVGTAIYFGAIVFFLFLLGAWIVKGPVKWWLVASGLFAVSLAWGNNFFLNDVLYNILPMFNKFRAVTMALGVGQLFFAVLAGLALQSFFSKDIPAETKKQGLYFAGGVTLLLALIAGFGGVGSGANDAQLAEQMQMPNLPDILKNDRAALARSDAFRSIGFIAVAFGILWFALRGRLKSGIAVILLSVLALADHAGICLRSISSDSYSDRDRVLAGPPEKEFDKAIKQNAVGDLYYRVLDLSRGGFTSNSLTSYHHKSMSGYHAAKLQRYQEVVDTFLTSDLGSNLHILGMFNCKYVVNQQEQVLPIGEALGNAWFVQRYRVVENGDQEIAAMHTFNPRVEAIIQKKYADKLNGLKINPDSTANIRLTAYHPEKLTFEYSAKSDQFAVFSDMYYPPEKGWHCYLNGERTDDFVKCNYTLRGMRLPKGQNMKLEMRFEPRSFAVGKTISFAGSLLILLLFLGGLYFWYRGGGKVETNELAELAEDKPKAKESTTKKTAATKPKETKSGRKPQPKGGRKKK